MKKLMLIILLLSGWRVCFAQNTTTDSLRNELAKTTQDSTRLRLMVGLTNMYKFNQPDSALHYGYKALDLSTKLNNPRETYWSLHFLADTYTTIGDYAKALQLRLQSLKICNQNHLMDEKAFALSLIGLRYAGFHDYTAARKCLDESIAISDSLRANGNSIIVDINSVIERTLFSQFYQIIGKPDSALYYAQSAYGIAQSTQLEWVKSYAMSSLAKAQYQKGDTALAIRNLKIANRGLTGSLTSNLTIAQFYEKSGNRDSSLVYAKKALQLALKNGFYSDIVDSYTFLSKFYQNDPKKGYLYTNLALAYKDSLFNLGMTTAGESFVTYNEQQQKQALEEARKENQSRIRTNTLLGSLFTLLLVAIILFFYSRSRQKAKIKIESAYDQLKATQSQLIQSEKMASLGELTAGIAHEIKNPLNFVNNFSEISTELLDEMKGELENGNTDEANEIIEDLKNNLEKINRHGKRADSIVKGMLLHSRGTSGEKMLTDINDLLEQYVNLAYHGMRAQDKEFNIAIERDYDKSLDKINVVPQDISRVFLNIINNGCYAANDKKKKDGDDFSPKIKVSTKNLKDKVEIRVKDNGNGVPDKIKDKLFQPFFTTKPTGEGTGLGLSLSYDIVVKQHGGKIRVESKEGEGAEFIIQLSNQ